MINISDEYYKILINKFYNNTLIKTAVEALYNNKFIVMLEDEFKTKYFFKINDFDAKCDKFELYLTSKNNELGELFIYGNEFYSMCVLDYKCKRTLVHKIIITDSFNDILEHMI